MTTFQIGADPMSIDLNSDFARRAPAARDADQGVVTAARKKFLREPTEQNAAEYAQFQEWFNVLWTGA
jgi:hypothetical protein